MKNTKFYFTLILAFAFVFITACSDDKDEQGQLPDSSTITHADVLGVYKVMESKSSTVLDDDIWDIKVKNINIACGDLQAYSYKNNSLSVEDETYTFERMEDVESFKVSNKNGAFILKKTKDVCGEDKEPEEGEGPAEGEVELDKLYGYAEGVTGGEGGKIHHFDSGTKFRDWLKLREKKSTEPAIIWLSGAFTKADGRDTGSPWFDIKDTENLTIYGTNSFKMKNVGLFLVRAKNIIIRNIYIEMPKADNGADGISMQESEKIWIDHCTFESMNQTKDYEDGSCDVTHGTKSVTISWSHFMKTQKTSLIGHTNNENSREKDSGITVTMHHNFFDLSSSRHPRVRYGKAHVYNNLYNGVTTYGAGSAYSAKVLLEGNYFDGVHLPTDICSYPAKKSGNNWVSNLTGSEAGFLYEADNFYTNKPSNSSDPYPFTNVEFLAYAGETLATPLTRDDFTPSYNYVITTPEKVKGVVQAGSGVGKLSNFETAPIEVDNGGIEGGEEPEPTDPEESKPIEVANGWSAVSVGNDSKGTFSVASDGGITVSGLGKLEGKTQTFYYIYREVEGDFIATAKVDNYDITAASNQAQAGLLFTPDFTTKEADFLHALMGKGGKSATEYNYSQRIATGTDGKRGAMTAPTSTDGTAYLKLERKGNDYIVSYSLDGGVTYSKERKDTFKESLPNKLYIGLAVNSGSNTAVGTAKFSNVKINGISIGFED